MDFKELMDGAQALADEAIATGTQHPAETLGLDRRCGSLWVSEEWIATEQPRMLNYYGGFEYIEDRYVTTLGSWTFYSAEDETERVEGAIAHLEWEDGDPVLSRLIKYAGMDIPREDLVIMDHEITKLRDMDWDDDRIFRFLKNHECVNPELPEDVALANMARIRREDVK